MATRTRHTGLPSHPTADDKPSLHSLMVAAAAASESLPHSSSDRKPSMRGRASQRLCLYVAVVVLLFLAGRALSFAIEGPPSYPLLGASSWRHPGGRVLELKTLVRASGDDNEDRRDDNGSDGAFATDRRAALSAALAIASSLSASLVVPPKSSVAAPSAPMQPSTPFVPQTETLVPRSRIASLLHAVPTFVIVDPRGVPFTVFGEDAKVTGYFFTTYPEADRVLKLAKSSSDKTRKELTKEIQEKRKAEGLKPLGKAELEEEVGVNPWVNARISTVPLDFAVTLVTRSKAGQAGPGVYFQIAPAEEDVEDAVTLDSSGTDELPEGKVPIFYFESMHLPSSVSKEEAKNLSPLYFRKSELLAEWDKQNPGKKGTTTERQRPKVLVSELFATLDAMTQPLSSALLEGMNSDDLDDIRNSVFIPPAESAKKAELCQKAGGKEPPFRLGERIVVL